MSEVLSFPQTVAFGADHAGYALKEYLKGLVEDWGAKSIDCGTYSDESVDYSDYIDPVVQEVLKGAIGVLVCGSGVGISIGANRYRGIRAALCQDSLVAKLSREHNDANILVLGSRIIGEDEAEACLVAFLKTSFEGGRHQFRVEKLDQLGEGHE